jgi:hypothetical protein
MHARVAVIIGVLACRILAAPAVQEGYPLIGTWSGEWGPSPDKRTQVVVVMEWDGETLSGIINPGYPDAATIRVGELDSTKWTVHLEAEAKDERGKPIRIVIDGKLENIGSYNRTLSGTWIQNNVRGDFKLTRD